MTVLQKIIFIYFQIEYFVIADDLHLNSPFARSSLLPANCFCYCFLFVFIVFIVIFNASVDDAG